MVSKDDRKAAFVLLGLATAGLVIRLAVGSGAAPGEVLYRPTDADRPDRDSLAVRAARLARPLGPGEKIDVDRASPDELTRLPRIGPSLAARIVADRESRGAFGSLGGLDRVAGIGPTVLEAVAPHVGFSGHASEAPGGRSANRIRVNTATAEELAELPGIGPARARAIVDYRVEHGPFRTTADLVSVKGIGPAILRQLETYVVVP